MTSLYTLDIATWSDICFVNVVCPLVAHCLLTGVFWRADIFNFGSVQFINLLWWLVLLCLVQEILTNSKSSNCFWNFIVLVFTFRLRIHLKLIFVCGMRQELRFFSSYGIQFFSHHLLKTFFSLWNHFVSFSFFYIKSVDCGSVNPNH